METARIAELLRPFLETPLQAEQLKHISIYIDMLLRWNARVNLTAVRVPEEVVQRHFGESIFAAQVLFPEGANPDETPLVLDIGSGAGFPGLPLKIWRPQARITLIEARQKKVAFLREVIRALTLTDINVFSGRAADYSGPLGDLVLLRAVEQFEVAVPVAALRVAGGGRLALLVGENQRLIAERLTPKITWSLAVRIPLSSSRVVLVGDKCLPEQEPNR